MMTHLPKHETKFVFQNDFAARQIFQALKNSLEKIEGYLVRSSGTQVLVDVYFDSHDLVHHREGESIRDRKTIVDGRPTYARTVKSKTLHDNIYRYYTDNKLIDVTSCGQCNTLPINGLVEIVQIQTTRTLLNFEDYPDHNAVEMHLDESLIMNSFGENKKIFFEIELVCDHNHLLHLEAVKNYIASAFNLIPIRRSKLERALGVTTQDSRLSRRTGPAAVILDMDPGVDDILAILFAMNSPNLDVKAITIVGGNAPMEQCTLNALRTANFARGVSGIDMPLPRVAKGLMPCGGQNDATDVHGPDGMGGVSSKHRLQDLDESRCIEGDAKETVREILSGASGKITLVCTGPLTNVAYWIKDDSLMQLMTERIEKIVAMGGVFFDCGNRSQTAEFNIFSDPVSAAEVLDFCRGADGDEAVIPLIFVGLDVTHRVRLKRATVEALPSGPIRDFLMGVTGYYMDFYNRNEGLDGCYLHDPLAVGYVADPTLCEIEQFHVEVETKGEWTLGMTVGDYRPTRLFKARQKEKTWVCYKVDANRFEKVFLDTVSGQSVKHNPD